MSNVNLSAGLAWMLTATLLTGCATSPTPSTAPPITKIEARTLPAQEVVDRVAAQLADVLMLSPYPSTGPRPVRPLTDLWFWTRPRATLIKGVCRSEQVVIDFQPTGLVLQNASTPSRAVGLETHPAFYFLTQPPSRFIEISSPSATADARACARLDPENSSFIFADDEMVANEGIWLLNRILEAPQSGQRPFQLTCRNLGYDACQAILTGLKASEVQEIASCSTWGDGPRCMAADFGSIKIKMFSDTRNSDVSRVEATEFVVVADSIID